MTSFTLQAPAKINYCLEVLGQRPDGFHEVRTVLQAVGLMDFITFDHAEDLKFESLSPFDVLDQKNLIIQAAHLLQRQTGSTLGARIVLDKHIPISGGLGGGSSDAAVTLLGLRRLWELELDDQKLLEMAAVLGSDVPFFIRGGTALGSGRGEELLALPTPKDLWVVILASLDKPSDHKTATLYGLLNRSHYSVNGDHSETVARLLCSGEPLGGSLFNVFDEIGERAFPSLNLSKKAMLGSGVTEVHIAGSGPSLFSLVSGQASAQLIKRNLSLEGYSAQVAPALSSWNACVDLEI